MSLFYPLRPASILLLLLEEKKKVSGLSLESLGYLKGLMSCWSSLLRLKEELCVNPLKARLEKRRRENTVGSAYQLMHSKALPNS